MPSETLSALLRLVREGAIRPEDVEARLDLDVCEAEPFPDVQVELLYAVRQFCRRWYERHRNR